MFFFFFCLFYKTFFFCSDNILGELRNYNLKKNLNAKKKKINKQKKFRFELKGVEKPTPPKCVVSHSD